MTPLDEYLSVALVWLKYVFFDALMKARIKLSNCSIHMTLAGLNYPLYLIHNMTVRAVIDRDKNYYYDILVTSSVMVLLLVVSWLIHTSVEKIVCHTDQAVFT